MFKKQDGRGRRLAVLGAVAAVGTLALAAVATAQSMGGGGHGWGFHQRGGAMMSPEMRGFRLAERLAGLQVYLGITPEQQPQWRAFTAAALAMVPGGPPGPGHRPGDAFAALDHIADRVEAMVQPAQHLRAATDALKAVLTPDQIGKANAMWASFHHRGPMMEHPPAPMGGPGAPPPGDPAAPPKPQ